MPESGLKLYDSQESNCIFTEHKFSFDKAAMLLPQIV